MASTNLQKPIGRKNGTREKQPGSQTCPIEMRRMRLPGGHVRIGGTGVSYGKLPAVPGGTGPSQALRVVPREPVGT